MAYTADPATIAALTAKNDYVTIPFGTGVEQVWTLDTYMAQWAAGVIAQPAALAGADPVSEAQAVAADRCGSTPTPDCSGAAQIGYSYGSLVAQAWSLGGYTGLAPAPPATGAPAGTTTVSAGGFTPSISLSGTTATGGPAPLPASTAPAAAAVPASQFQAHFLDAGTGGSDIGGGIATIGLVTVNPILFGVGIAISVISSLFGAIFGGSGDIQKLAKQVDQLKQATEAGLDQATRFTWAVGNGVATTWLAITNIWDNFLDALWSALKGLWKLLWCLAATVLPKIIQALKDLRKFLDWIYQNYIRKIMNYLQLIRRWLQILKLLHVPFAAKLDSIITRIQGALFTPFLYLLRSLNGFGAWYNVILTADLVLQKPIFLRTMWAYQGEWINMWWAAQSATATSGGGVPTTTGPAPPTIQSEAASVHEFVLTGAGDYGVLAAESKALSLQFQAGL